MWIVRLALRRPYTFIVLAILLLLGGPVAILRTPTDIFPKIDIPVVSVVWTLQRLVRRRHGAAHRRRTMSVRADHRRRQYRAHRIAVVATASRSSRCFSTPAPISIARSPRPRPVAQSSAQVDAARCHAAAGRSATTPRPVPILQPRTGQRHAAGAATVRPRQQFYPHAAGHGAGRRRSRCPTAARSAR